MKFHDQNRTVKRLLITHLTLLISALLFYPSQTKAQMYVNGRFLYSQAGEQVILKGVNEFYWPISDLNYAATTEMSEIAKTGANCVRIGWLNAAQRPLANLDSLINHCIQDHMIPVVACHDATTTDWSALNTCLAFWETPAVVALIEKYKKWVVLNIANEEGTYTSGSTDYVNNYSAAVTALRNAGYDVPFMIDASDYGQNENSIFDNWSAITNADPKKDVLYSLHTYWQTAAGGDVNQRFSNFVSNAVNNSVPVVIGEGIEWAGYNCVTDWNYSTAIQLCQNNNIGFIPWSWGLARNGNCPNYTDITTNGLYGSWTNDWGRLVMTDDPNSIQKTAIRPPSIFGSTGGTGTSGSQVIYDDQLENGWVASGGANYNLSSTAVVKDGSDAISMSIPSAWQALVLTPASAVNVSGATGITFWGYGGTGGTKLQLIVYDQNNNETGRKQMTLTQGGWNLYTVNFSDVGNPTQIGNLIFQDWSGGAQPVFYLDDINIAGSTTTGTPPSSGPLMLYGDAMENGWTSSGGANYNLSSTAVVEDGSDAISIIIPSAWQAVIFTPPSPVNVSSYNEITFWGYGGTGGTKMQVIVYDNNLNETGRKQLTLTAGNWSFYKVNFSDVGNPTQIGQIIFQDWSGGAQPVFYLDDIAINNTAITGSYKPNAQAAESLPLTSANTKLAVYPSPASTEAHVVFSADQAQTVQIAVTSITGARYATYSFNALKGSNDFRIPVNNTSPVQIISVYHDNRCESVKLLVNP